MKRYVLAITIGFFLAGGLVAGPLYQVSFSGTITSGTAWGFDPAIANNKQTAFADLTGMTVSGSLFFDLGLAPAPTVSVDNSGFITTEIQSTALPVFVSDDFVIHGFTVPAGFFPMPTDFNQPALPSTPGSTVSVLQNQQSFSTVTKAIPAPQAILGGMNFQTTWSGPRFNGGSNTALDVLINNLTPFFAVPPMGSFPSSWSGPVSGQNGVFGFGVLSQDANIQANFGIAQWYFVQGNFNIDFASGGFVVPEPGTLVLSAMALAVVAAARKRSDGRG